jgi:two-component system OmpR family response regulator
MAKLNQKVLIVEDEESFLVPLENVFSEAGFDVVLAKDGQEGLISAEKEKPNIMIIDIKMPKMGGIEMTKKLKEDGISIPTIFLTNVKDATHIADAMEAYRPDSDYIIKTDISLEDIVKRAKAKLGLE